MVDVEFVGAGADATVLDCSGTPVCINNFGPGATLDVASLRMVDSAGHFVGVSGTGSRHAGGARQKPVWAVRPKWAERPIPGRRHRSIALERESIADLIWGSTLTDTTDRSDAYLRWRQRLAAKQQAQRGQTDEPPKAPPNPMWDPAHLFESKAPVSSTDEVDLRTPIHPSPPSDRAADPSPEPPPTAAPTRRRALVASLARSQRRSDRRPAPSIAEALRDLNEQRLAGTISEDEFKARKAELFA
jgi:hypothetical protein